MCITGDLESPVDVMHVAAVEGVAATTGAFWSLKVIEDTTWDVGPPLAECPIDGEQGRLPCFAPLVILRRTRVQGEAELGG